MLGTNIHKEVGSLPYNVPLYIDKNAVTFNTWHLLNQKRKQKINKQITLNSNIETIFIIPF